MKNYYISKNGRAEGPLAEDEIIQLKLPETTHIWTDDATEWKLLSDFPELKKLAYKGAMPPPPPPALVAQSLSIPEATPPRKASQYQAIKFFGYGVTFIILAVILVALFKGFSNENDVTSGLPPLTTDSTPARELTPEELREQLRQKELNRPLDYLIPDGFQFHENLIGETVLYGNILNIASTATYKDVLLTFSFLSKTDTELFTHQERVYEFVSPSRSVGYKFKVVAPVSYSSIIVRVTRAKPVR